MDHIREELLRQEAVWRLLLLGGGTAEETEWTPAGAERTGEDAGQSGTVDAAAGRTEALPAAWSAPRETRRIENQTEAAAETLRHRLDGAWQRAENPELPERDGWETQALLPPRGAEPSAAEGQTAGDRARAALRWRSGEALWEGQAAGLPEIGALPGGAFAPARTTVETVQGAEPPAAGDAETLSRAFQRDARRYDGGFSLY